MTFFATVLFGAGALLFISALENTSLTQTLAQILAGNITIQQPPASSGASSGTSQNPNVSGPKSPAAPVNFTQSL